MVNCCRHSSGFQIVRYLTLLRWVEPDLGFRGMTSSTTTDRTAVTLQSTVLWAAGVAALWLAVAVARSGTTLHLGPLLVPVVPLVVARSADFALRAMAVASAMGLGVIGLLSATGNLNGPALDPFPSAFAESLGFLVAGTAIGVIGIVASRRS